MGNRASYAVNEFGDFPSMSEFDKIHIPSPAIVEKLMKQTLRAGSSPMPTRSYFLNRERLPPEELAKHRGKWIAVSKDGAQIVASAATPRELIKRLAIARKGPEDVVLGRVGNGEALLGGADLL